MEGVTFERVLKEYARIARATTPIEPESPSGNTGSTVPEISDAAARL